MIGGFFKKMVCVGVVCLAMGCSFRVPFGYPTPNNLINNVPDGPPAFQYGWAEGCETGVSGWVSEFYKGTGLARFRKNFTFADENPDYEMAWQIAFWYCMRIAERHEGRRRDKYAGL